MTSIPFCILFSIPNSTLCGEWGIRTPDTCNTYTAFRVRLFRPLRQLSFGIVLFYWKLSCSRLVNKGFKRRVRDSNPRFSYKPFWCCFLLLNSGLIFQIFIFVHTGFTRCLHDFFTLEKLCKGTKNSWYMQIFGQLFPQKMIYSFSNYFPSVHTLLGWDTI